MTKNDYIQEITAMLEKCDDEIMLDFIYKMLKRKSLHKAS